MKLLEGKIAIVTGAARGIGEGIALKFAEHGAHVLFTYVSDSSADKAKALEEKLNGLGIQAKGYKSNASDYNECEKLVAEVTDRFKTIDICVNNAGISKDNLLLRMSVEQWDEVIR
ncbi:MAG: SDR family NAD(P)-dependent oxidoreductase, partial [Chitinophagales bacterium]